MTEFAQSSTPGLQKMAAWTGLNVVAIEQDDSFVTDLEGDTALPHDGHLLPIGSDEQVETFVRLFE